MSDYREIAPLRRKLEPILGEVEGPYLYPSPALRELMEGVERDRSMRIVECGSVVWRGTVAEALAMCR